MEEIDSSCENINIDPLNTTFKSVSQYVSVYERERENNKNRVTQDYYFCG